MQLFSEIHILLSVSFNCMAGRR